MNLSGDRTHRHPRRLAGRQWEVRRHGTTLDLLAGHEVEDSLRHLGLHLRALLHGHERSSTAG